jgi:bifunctional non-homologous end joining protein LigD
MAKSPFEACIPSRGTKVPDRPEWIHEIKHDGYHLFVQRDGKRVRLFTRNGHDWSGRFPLISEATLRNRNSSFVLDGEAVLLGVDGRSDFNGLHSRKHDVEVEFYAFDILVSDGEDLRKLPLSMRKANLARLLARRVDGIFLSDFEHGEIGPDLFRHACLMGLEAWSPSTARVFTAPVDRRAGSRSRTGSVPPSAACRISSDRCAPLNPSILRV